MTYDYLIAGAGLAGCTLAERLANEAGAKVLLIDRRDHVAGNCYDACDRDGPPCYPIPTAANRQRYARYEGEADKLDGVHFLGRLAQYEYLNMDQVVGRALDLFRRIQTDG